MAKSNKDFSILENDSIDETLVSAILISLFTDKRVTEDETDQSDKRGYWGDEDLGSKLWLLDRENISDSTRTKAKEYTEEALQWLTEDGEVTSLNIETSYVNSHLIIKIHSLGLAIDYTDQKIL